MNKRRLIIPQKLPILLLGEGKSEQGYGRWLNKIARTHKLPFHFNAEGLKGGDPLDLLQKAIEKMKNLTRSRESFKHVALLLDSDLRGQNPERDEQAIRTAAQHNIHLIWQLPCHEAFLLRHFIGKQNKKPRNHHVAKRQLEAEWHGYEKGQDAVAYGKKLTLDHLSRARAVETDLNDFLVLIGWD